MKEQFLHGGNVAEAGRRLGVSEQELLDFSANINPLGLSPEVKEHLQQSFWRLEHYPDPQNQAALNALSRYHRCLVGELVLGNGAAELFQLLCLALTPARVVAVEPTYSGYAFVASLYAIPYVGLMQDPESHADVKVLTPELRRGDLLFLCNPNNPTGRVYSRAEIEVLVNACNKAQATLVLDESFYDFLPADVAPQSYIDEVTIPAHVVVVRSLTKIMAVPGLRLGYLRAHASVAELVRAKRDPWSVNALALEAAVMYPKLTGYTSETRALVQRENRYLRQALSACAGLRVVSGEVNFLFAALVAGATSTEYCEKLLLRRIMVRNCNTFLGLGEKYIRLAVRTHEENQRLVSALVEVGHEAISH